MKPSKTPHHVLYQHCRFPNQVGTKYCFSFSKKHQLDYFSLLQGCIHQMLVTTGKTFNSQQKLFRYLITQLQCKQTKCQNLKTQFPKDLIYGSANNKRIFSKLNVHKTFRRRPGRVLHISCTFNLRPVSRGNIFIRYMTNVLKSRKKIQLCLERWLL